MMDRSKASKARSGCVEGGVMWVPLSQTKCPRESSGPEKASDLAVLSLLDSEPELLEAIHGGLNGNQLQRDTKGSPIWREGKAFRSKSS